MSEKDINICVRDFIVMVSYLFSHCLLSITFERQELKTSPKKTFCLFNFLSCKVIDLQVNLTLTLLPH